MAGGWDVMRNWHKSSDPELPLLGANLEAAPSICLRPQDQLQALRTAERSV